MDSYLFLKYAKIAVHMHLKKKGQYLKPSDIYHVQTAFVLGNNKGTFSGPNSDGLYYEVTYNKEKNEFYVDEYEKLSNTMIKPEQLDLDLWV